MIAVSTELAAALAAPANRPLDLYELALTSGTRYWSTEAITWNSQAYTAMVVGRSASVQNMRGEFNQVSIRVSNVSTTAAQILLGESIEGRRITIRKIDRSVTNDSVVIFSGVMQRISHIDAEEAVIEAVELLGSIDDQFGRPFQGACSISEFKGPICRYAGGESSCDRSWAQCSGYGNTESFFGIRFLEHQGAFQYVETQVKRFLLFFKRKKKTRRQGSYSGIDDTPRGTAVPQVWGRTMVAAVPLYHEDQGGVVKGVSVFSGGPVDQIGYYRANDQLVAAVTEHQGQLGGLGNQIVDTRLANLYEFSGLAYITYDVPSLVEEVDPAPVITGLVKGRLVRHYNTSGAFTGLSWDDNAALCTADFMLLEIDHGGMGISESDLNLTSLGLTAAYCDGAVPDTTGGTVIYQPASLPEGQTLGEEYRRFQPSGVIGHDPMADGPYLVYEPGVDDDTDTPASVSVKRWTVNVAVAERRSKVDILFDTLFPAFRGFRRYDKNGKIEILAEQANPFSTLSGSPSAGVSSVSVASSAGFAAGKFVILGPHTANAEVRGIASAGGGSIGLDAPTDNAHTSGDEALQVDARLDDANLIGKIQYPLSGRSPSYNRILVNYIDAPAGFEEIPLSVDDFGDQILRRKTNVKEIDATAVDNYFQAWRLGQTEIAKSRDFAKWAQVTGDISLSLLEVGDVVSLSSGEHGLSAVPFRVEQKADEEDHSVSLLLQIYASGMYDDVAPRTTLQVPSVFAPILPGEVGLPDAPADVTDLAVVSAAQDPDDPTLYRIELSYSPPDPLGDFDGVEVHVERPEAAEASPLSYAGPGQIDPYGWAPSDGSDPSRIIVRLPYPGKRTERWHVYAASRSEFVSAPLVHRGEASPTPSLPVDVPANPGGVTAPNVTGLSLTRIFRALPLRSRSAEFTRTLDYVDANWTLPTGDPNFAELAYLRLTMVNQTTSEEKELVVLVVGHAAVQPVKFSIHSFPSPDTPTDFKVRVYAVNRFGRISASPAESAAITMGDIPDAPPVTAPSATPYYQDVGGVPHYGWDFAWTLPTGDADYDEGFDRVEPEGRVVGTGGSWIVFAKEGQGSTGVRTSSQPRQAFGEDWEFRFVSVNPGGVRNVAEAVSVGPITVTAAAGATPGTGFSASRYQAATADGVETWGLQGTVDPQTIGANYQGTEIVGQVYEGNQIAQPSALNNAWWTLSNASVTADAVAAPDGTTTADLLKENSATSTHLAQSTGLSSLADNENYILACHVQRPATNGRHVTLGLLAKDGSFTFVRFNTATGAVLDGGGPLVRSWATDAGGGWWFVGIEANMASGGTTPLAQIYVAQAGAENYTGDGVSGVYIWHAFVARFDSYEHRYSVTNGLFQTDNWPIANGPFVVWLRAYAQNQYKQRTGSPESRTLFIAPGVGGLNAARLSEESLTALEIVDGKLQPKMGAGLGIDADSIRISVSGVVNAMLGAGAVTGPKILANSIGAVDAVFQDAAILSAKIASLVASKISAGTLVSVNVTAGTYSLTVGFNTMTIDGTNGFKQISSNTLEQVRIVDGSIFVEETLTPLNGSQVATDGVFVFTSGGAVCYMRADIGQIAAIHASGSVTMRADLAQLHINGQKVVSARQAAVADASGGSTVDTEARAAINALLARLRTHGLIAP